MEPHRAAPASGSFSGYRSNRRIEEAANIARDSGSEAIRDAGSFGSPPTNRLDCGEPMLGEVLEALDDFVSEAAYQGQRGIAERGEHFRRMTRMGARLIFTTADIAYVMKTILDAPMCT